MIHEIRTYDLKTGAVPDYQGRFAERLPGRLKLSELGGHWYMEVGPLNQIVAIWPYDDLEQRARIRREAEASGVWPPDTGDLIVSMRSEIYLPAPFMTPLGYRRIGPIYEMRLYTYAPEQIPEVLSAWSAHVGARERLSPLAGCWYTEHGGLNNFIHMWAYESLNQRAQVRQEARESGVWPPPGGPKPVRQENRILLPASFSPMR